MYRLDSEPLLNGGGSWGPYEEAPSAHPCDNRKTSMVTVMAMSTTAPANTGTVRSWGKKTPE